MKLEDLVIRLKIEEDNRNAEKKLRKSSTIIGVNIVEEAPTKDKKGKKSNVQKSEHAKKKFRGNCYNCGKDVIGLLIVVLQERTNTKAKAKVKQTSWRRWKMQMTCVQ